MATSSTSTISTTFFDNLWPLILSENVCDIRSQNHPNLFVPERKFDHEWAHELLAAKHFGEYEKPLLLNCSKPKESQEGQEANINELQQLPYRTPVPPIIPLDQQIAAIEHDVEIRKKLAYDFANRQFPWYVQRPSYCSKFTITADMKKIFVQPFEYEILHNIQMFQCSLMIVDVAAAVGLKDLERWLKFSPYVAIVTVVHCADLYRQLRNFGKIFLPVLLEENPVSAWHDELNRAVKMGVATARDFHLYDDGSKAFVFVFSNNRDICTCDKFKILRKL